MGRRKKEPKPTQTLKDICDLLQVENEEDVLQHIQTIMHIVSLPIHGVVVTWKPAISGSLSFTPINISPTDADMLLDAARALDIVRQDLTARAVQISRQQTIEDIRDDSRPDARNDTED